MRTVLLVCLAAVTMACGAATPAPDSAAIDPAFEQMWLAKPRVPVATPGGPARVTVAIFLDWQCPACRAEYRAYSPVVDDIERAHPGAVRVFIKDFPLNARCNPVVPVEMHPAACEAAVAVRLAREQGAAVPLIDWLFANQEALTPNTVKDAAARVGRVADFDTRAPEVLTAIAADVREGAGLEIRSTPTVYVNGRLARTAANQLLSAAEFRQALLIELK